MSPEPSDPRAQASPAKGTGGSLNAPLAVHTIPDSSCAATKTISDRASVHTRAVSCGGANTMTERSCAAPISKAERHISDSFCAIVIVWCSVNTYSARRGSKYEGARTGTR